MWEILGKILTGPIINGILQGYQAKLKSNNTEEKINADLAARELDLQGREVEAQKAIRIAEIGKWYEPDKLMGYAVAIYFGKLLIWDKVLGLGATDPLRDWAATTANVIVMFYYGKRGIENVMRIFTIRR